MEEKQRINCTVTSCKYNNEPRQKCELEDIIVQACPGCNDGTAQNESMCGSYKCARDCK